TQLYHKYSLFLNTTAAPKSYPLSLHDALPILTSARSPERLEFGGAPPRATQQPRDIAHARGAGRNVLHSGARQERRVVEPREHFVHHEGGHDRDVGGHERTRRARERAGIEPGPAHLLGRPAAQELVVRPEVRGGVATRRSHDAGHVLERRHAGP